MCGFLPTGLGVSIDNDQIKVSAICRQIKFTRDKISIIYWKFRKIQNAITLSRICQVIKIIFVLVHDKGNFIRWRVFIWRRWRMMTRAETILVARSWETSHISVTLNVFFNKINISAETVNDNQFVVPKMDFIELKVQGVPENKFFFKKSYL